MTTTKTTSKEVRAEKAKKTAKPKETTATEAQRKAWRLDLVREPLVDKALEEQGLDRSGTVAEKAERLDAHYRNTIPIDQRLDCVPDKDTGTGCGFTGPATTSACPFCGSTQLDERDSEDVARVRAGGKPAPEPPAPEPPAESKSRGAEIVQVSDAEIVSDQPIDADKRAQLDEAVKRVVEVHAAGVANYWDLGQALLPIYERQLYLQRRNDDGSARYRGWTQFLAGEFGGQITAGHSHRVMDVARAFDRETAVRIGVAKLSLLVRAKPDALPRLLKAAETQTVKELAVSARPDLIAPGQRDTARPAAATGKGRSSGSETARKEGVAMASKRAEAKADDAISVATTLGTVKIPLFVRGANKRAKKLSDDPRGEEVHVNGVITSYSVVIGADGGLELLIVRRRVKG